MTEKAKTSSKAQVGSIDLPIFEIEEKNIITSVDGWRIRVSIEKLSDIDKKSLVIGKIISVKYEGDLSDVHTLKLLPLEEI